MLLSQIEKDLKNNLKITYLKINDNSVLHYNHNSFKKNKLHIEIIISCDDFVGKDLIEKHRIVHNIIEKYMDNIHAVSIKIKNI